jgi:hypothetical protein
MIYRLDKAGAEELLRVLTEHDLGDGLRLEFSKTLIGEQKVTVTVAGSHVVIGPR